MIEELVRSLHCIHIGSGRNKHHQLGDFVHNHHHRVMILVCHGQGGNKVHTHASWALERSQTKVDAIKTWLVPRCKTDVQSFLGMVNFYRRFIMNCARISRPLTQLTGNTPFTWDDKTQEAFERLKQALCTAPVLRTFDPQLPIVVTTDASGFAIGAVL
jgi:RNase H-like domain found in reverse transcriptase